MSTRPPYLTLGNLLRSPIGPERAARLKRSLVERLLPPPSHGRGLDAASRARLVERIRASGAVPGVNLMADLRPTLGLGRAARSLLHALLAAGVEVSLAGPVEEGGEPLPEVPRTGFIHPVNLLHHGGATLLRCLASGELPARALEGHYSIGCWVWEQEELPPEWLPAFAYLDEIWTPSAASLDAISRVSPVPVLRVPYACEHPSTPEPEGRYA